MRVFKGALGVMAILGVCLPGLAQSSRVSSATAGLGKVDFYVEMHLEPGVPQLASVSDGVRTDGQVVQRFLQDHERGVYFGYDVRVETLPEANTYRVTFGPLTLPPQEVQRMARDETRSWTRMQPPGWGSPLPETRTIRGGEVIALNLLTNNTTGQKIVDYVTIQEKSRPPVTFANINTPAREFTFVPGPARDFRVEDGELRIRAPRLSVNGKFDETSAALNTEVAGPIVWFYAANHGRFLLSLTPQAAPGFRKAGEVRGSTLSFTIGKDTYNLVAGAAIAGSQAPFNLYVLHEPSWKPTYPFADTSRFILGAAERAELLTGKGKEKR